MAVLRVYGIRTDGRKLLQHLALEDKESTVCWTHFFEDMKQRGLKARLVVVIDGNSGLPKAGRDCFPDSCGLKMPPVATGSTQEAELCADEAFIACDRALREAGRVP